MIYQSSINPTCLIVRFKHGMVHGCYRGQHRGCHYVGDLLNLGKMALIGEWGATVICRWESDVPQVKKQIEELLKNWRWQFALQVWGN